MLEDVNACFQVEKTREAQAELKDQIEALAAELKNISDQQSCPVDLGRVLFPCSGAYSGIYPGGGYIFFCPSPPVGPKKPWKSLISLIQWGG